MLKIRPGYLNLIKYTVIIGWLFILFLVSINYLDRINEVMIYLGVYTIFLMIVLRNKPSLNLEFVLLLAFGTAYFFIYIQYRDYTTWTYVKYWLGSPMMYFMGKSFISLKTKSFFKWIIYIVVFGLFIYAGLNMIDYVKEYATGSGPRYVYEFWKGHMINAPLMGVYITPMGTLIIYNLFHLNFKKDIVLKIIHLILFGLSIYFTIILANRSYFLIVPIVFVCMYLLQLVLNKFKMLKPTFIATVFIGLIYYAYRFDFLGVKTFIIDTDWYVRIIKTMENGLLSDGRFKVYPFIRDQFDLYPLGGYQMDLGGIVYAHNLWLDVLFAVGLYPFYMLVAYSALTLFTLFKLNIAKNIDISVKLLVSSVFLGFTLNFMVEPILEGVPYVFFLFCLINGATYEYVKVSRIEEKLAKLQTIA